MNMMVSSIRATRGSEGSGTCSSRSIVSRCSLPVILLAVGWSFQVLPFSRSLGTSAVVAHHSAAALPADFKRIDTHAHFLPPFYYDTLKRMGLNAGGRTVPEWNASGHLAFMEELRIETGILSISTPGARLPGYSLLEARSLARKLNEYGHMLSVTYPGRFQFFATLVLPDVQGSIQEAVYALDTLKAAGVVLLANSEGYYLGAEEFDPLMEVLNTRETTIFIHPNSVPGGSAASDSESQTRIPRGVPQFVVDFLLDTTRAAASLVMNNVTGRYPKLHWILAHSGGFMPFAGNRIGGALSLVTKASPENLLKELRTFYADTALSSSPSALLSTIAFLSHDHITFGSDFPFAPTPVIERETAGLDKFLMDHDKKHLINYQNAYKLFSKRLNYQRNHEVSSSPAEYAL